MSDHVKRLIYIKDLEDEPGASGLLSQYKDHTDPKYIGPGTWDVTHRRAFKARTHEQQVLFIEYMKDICYGFPCIVCKGHCTEYIKNHPMEDYLDILVDINGEKLQLGMFIWCWKFHNAVNARLNKPLMSWDTAYNLFNESESLVCSKNCLEAEGAPPDGLEHEKRIIVPVLPEPSINWNGANTKSKINGGVVITTPTSFKFIPTKGNGINTRKII